MNLTLIEIARLAEGELSANSNPNLTITQVAIDSRLVKIGDLFVAIKGDNDDGHHYVEGLFNNLKDNLAAIVSDKVLFNSYPNLIYVEDTTKALGIFSSNYRQKFNIPVVGITGSNGKTTVKEMLKCICIAEFGIDAVLATTGTLNNHWGMPLTLLSLTSKHKVAIIEMGMNHAGELDYLTKLAKPTVATVINVMMAHAGFFNDTTDIARAKGEIYHGLIDNGVACVNLTVPFHKLWDHDISSKKVFYYGTSDTDCYLLEARSDGTTIIYTKLGVVETKLQILGRHNQDNAVAVVALALQIGCSLNSIILGLQNYTGYQGRLERKKSFNGALIIDDSYNGNPDSVKAGISAIKDLPKPHWLLLADLGELGKFSDQAHTDIGKYAAQNEIDMLLTYGEYTKLTHQSFVGPKQHFEDKTQLINYCKKHLPANSTLLVKGSKKAKLYEVINKLV